MSFDIFIKQAWNDHANKTADVAQRLRDGVKDIGKTSDITQWVGIATHVFGEHLGAWQEGVALLNSLKQNSFNDDESSKALARSIASLQYSGGDLGALEGFSGSDRIRILAVSASALSQHGELQRAQEAFELAIKEASKGIPKEDPANRALAITGNNLAISFEEKKNRTSAETALMIFAAKVGREYWEIAGTWLETERAEYRLAMTYLAADNFSEAMNHAQECLRIVGQNGNLPLESFFGQEAIGKIQASCGSASALNTAIAQAEAEFQRLTDADKLWCQATLDGLIKLRKDLN